MQIDWQHFTPWSALAGGVLIGLSAGLFALLAGRIAGISGIVGGLFRIPMASSNHWRWAFVGGLIVAALIWRLTSSPPAFALSASLPQSIAAGLLVGLGTRYANGCTSGHGVCGLARFSVRSLAAVLAFMAAGFITVYLLRHVAA
ncbi:YeeE/YedE family protein [Andreprevotia chitinilytica]|uniref:YeeE/YedE family protein n=1 Tax=Andreprevotia chitinilytica TaxID=396808 RepID=UPI00055921C9|nr:YeeE/YedE thiosulfate transporter family protein [Andreprevotia chitinilytica]